MSPCAKFSLAGQERRRLRSDRPSYATNSATSIQDRFWQAGAKSLARLVKCGPYCGFGDVNYAEFGGMSEVKASSTAARRTTSFRTSPSGRLRSLLMDAVDPVLLLGAGASITSGIPAAGTTVEKVARWAWCKENGRHPDDFTIRSIRLLALAHGTALVQARRCRGSTLTP